MQKERRSVSLKFDQIYMKKLIIVIDWLELWSMQQAPGQGRYHQGYYNKV